MKDGPTWAIRGTDLPVLTAEQRIAAEQAVAVFDQMPRGSSPSHIAKLFGMAVLAYPAVRMSDGESDARLSLYQSELGDIDEDTLAKAFSLAVRSIKFFPSVAELRAFAKDVPTPRRYVVASRLRALLAQRAPEPIDLVKPEQLAGLLAGLGSHLSVGDTL